MKSIAQSLRANTRLAQQAGTQIRILRRQDKQAKGSAARKFAKNAAHMPDCAGLVINFAQMGKTFILLVDLAGSVRL